MKESMTFRKPLGQLLHEIYESTEPDELYIGFYILHKPVLLLRDLNLIKRVMVSEFENFSNRRFGGPTQRDSVRRLTELIVNSGDSMVKFVDDMPADKNGWKTFEVKDISFRYTNDVIASIAFGIETNSFDKNDTAFVEAEPLTTGAAKFFRRIFWDSINFREKDGNTRGDLIDYFLTLKNGDQNPYFKFEGDNLLGQAVSYYVAGLEATSSAIAFSLYELSRHPKHQEHLYREIMDTVAQGELNFESINKMEFMEKVVNETLRMYPPLSILDRVPLERLQGQRLGKTITKIALISILKGFIPSSEDGTIGVFTTAVDGVHVKLKRRERCV